MPKATRAKESTTPKKRSRQAVADGGNGVQAEPVTNSAEQHLGAPSSPETVVVTPKRSAKSKPENGNGSHASESAKAPASAEFVPDVEEKIRQRAYELYLERRGMFGSPEQDWLQAQAEICGQHGWV